MQISEQDTLIFIFLGFVYYNLIKYLIQRISYNRQSPFIILNKSLDLVYQYNYM